MRNFHDAWFETLPGGDRKMRNFHDAWFETLEETLERPEHVVSPRGMLVRERLAVKVTFDASASLLVHPTRDLNYRFAVAEAVWIAAGLDTVEPIARYNSVMRKFSDDGVTLAGAYGPRLATQWDWVLNQIVRDNDTRQAVNVIWTPAPAPSKDIPCTLTAQFILRGDQLHSVWSMRSSDLWLGLPYDAFSFSFIAACLAGEVARHLERRVEPGTITITAGSSHLYDTHWADARAVLDARGDARSAGVRPLNGFPPDCLKVQLIDPQQACRCGACLVGEWVRYSKVLDAPGKAEALTILEDESC
jgi:thymidylate synthase